MLAEAYGQMVSTGGMRTRSQWKSDRPQPSREVRGSKRRIRRLSLREHTDAWVVALLASLLFGLLAAIT